MYGFVAHKSRPASCAGFCLAISPSPCKRRTHTACKITENPPNTYIFKDFIWFCTKQFDMNAARRLRNKCQLVERRRHTDNAYLPDSQRQYALPSVSYKESDHVFMYIRQSQQSRNPVKRKSRMPALRIPLYTIYYSHGHGAETYQKSKPAVLSCETCRFGLQYRPFHRPKRAVLEAETARFATPLIINHLQRQHGSRCL